VFGEAAAGSDGGAASAGEIVAIGAEDAFDDAEMAQTGELSTPVNEETHFRTRTVARTGQARWFEEKRARLS
jgi:hypothetical protein